MKRTFLISAKELLDPVIVFPKRSGLLFGYACLVGLFNTYLVVFLEKITYAIETGNVVLFRQWILILVGLLFFHFLLKTFYKPRVFTFWRDIRNYLDNVYLKKFIEADNNDIESIGTGRLISIIGVGIKTWTVWLEELLWDRVITLSIILSSLWYIAQHSLMFFYATFFILLFAFFWIRFFGKKALIQRKSCKNIETELDRDMVRRYMSKFEIQSQDTYQKEVMRRDALYSDWWSHKLKEKLLQAYGYDTVVFISGFVYIIGITWYVGIGVFEGSSTYSDFVLLTGLGMMLWKSIFQLQMDVRHSMDKFVHIQKLWELFDSIKKIRGYEEGKTFVYKNGDIHLKQLCYGYDSQFVFNNFSLHISGGKKTALVGISGSGKTTLVKLIAGYLHADAGSVCIDGQKLTGVSLKSYYKQIGYLTQEPMVFDGTIRENLLYSLDDEEQNNSLDEKIHEAIVRSNCEFIYEFSGGVDTEIGEKGIRLSGGQRQRLAIAKIFIKNPKIVILDEPTSALDSFSEEKITYAMHELFVGRTVIIIAHRLQTVKEADDIILLDEGIVKERGTHEELVALQGKYATMLELQTGF